MKTKINDFYSGIWAQSKLFIKFELTIKELETIKRGVLNDLNLADSFKLNDRFEGVEYLERAILKSSPFIFFKKYFDIEVPCKKYGDYEKFASISIEGKQYNNVIIKFGELPKLKVYNQQCDTIIFIRRDKRIFYFAGILPYHLAKDGTIDFTQIDFENELFTKAFKFL